MRHAPSLTPKSSTLPHHRLNWPEGAPNRKSVKAVKSLPALRHIILKQGDQSASPYVDTICDLIGALLR